MQRYVNQDNADRSRLQWLNQHKDERRELANREREMMQMKQASLNERKAKLKALLDAEYEQYMEELKGRESSDP